MIFSCSLSVRALWSVIFRSTMSQIFPHRELELLLQMLYLNAHDDQLWPALGQPVVTSENGIMVTR